MSGKKFQVHGIHEHEVAHQAEQGISLSQYIAIFTAILSTLTAIISYHASSIQGKAMLLKNEAVIKQNQASDQWAFYQAKSTKQHFAEIASQLVSPAKAKFYESEVQRYHKEKNVILQQANQIEQASLDDNAQSNKLLRHAHPEEQGIVLLQIAISLASITALTRKKWLFLFAGGAAAVGLVLSLFVWLG